MSIPIVVAGYRRLLLTIMLFHVQIPCLSPKHWSRVLGVGKKIDSCLYEPENVQHLLVWGQHVVQYEIYRNHRFQKIMGRNTTMIGNFIFAE